MVLEDSSQIIVRWNDNAPVTMVCNNLGSEPLSTCSRSSRQNKKYMVVPQPHIIQKYNVSMGRVDRLDQNINHLRICISVKKWHYRIVTWLLDTAVQNAWQLHQKSGENLSALNFRREMVCVILRSASEAHKRLPSGGKVSTPGDNELCYNCVGHFVVIRRVCAYEGCKTRCQTLCDKCDCALCVDHFKRFLSELCNFVICTVTVFNQSKSLCVYNSTCYLLV